MAAILDGAAYGPPGENSPAALAMRQRLSETGVTAQHCHDVLQAFRLDSTEALIAAARDMPPRVAARGLRWESAVIVALAGRLALRLRRGDPLATRLKLSKNDFTAAFLTGILARRG